ncbi:TetR/AcrR family transcriptional regulator [Leucobacter luti]|uniref:TetR/AcrR family transcriptional regulator n=1 Tax=Leucobacter luti TaxID=340320 RepID=UPI003D07492D
MQQAPPRRRDPAARRRAILEAAADLVVERGTAALTHRAVAARAGVPLGSTTQYFSSIDELREEALQLLATEIEEALSRMEPAISQVRTDPEAALAEAIDFLADRRAVLSDVALMTTATTDPRLRALAMRWTERLIEMLEPHIGRERAGAIAIFLDGATLHAALTEAPMGRPELRRVLTALIAMEAPDPDRAPDPEIDPEPDPDPEPRTDAAPEPPRSP